MAPLILLLVAFAGTGALIGVGFLLGFSKSERISSPAAAIQILEAAVANVAPVRAVLAKDRRSAMILCEQGRKFLILMLGDSPVFRLVRQSDMINLDSMRTRIDFKDAGFPPFEFVADDEILATLRLGDPT